MGSTTASGHAPTLAASGGTLAALLVTIVVLLVLGALFWAFLRRGAASGVAPLAVDRLEGPAAAHDVPPAGPDDQVAHAIDDEISEGGPVDGIGTGHPHLHPGSPE